MSDNVNIIVQDTINEIVVNTAVVVETIDINVQVAVDEVNIIANPNNYVVNINRIIGEQVQSDWNQNDDQEPDYIKNKPSIPSIAGLATVVYVDQQDNLKVDKVAGKGLSENDFTNTLKTKLDGIESGAQVNVNADWNATTGDAEILNKPTIPAAQVNSDWNATSGVAEILNKPTIPAAVTNTSELINDGEDGVNPFITAADLPISVTSVGLTMPSAFSVANSPITSAGTLAVTGAGVVSQYVRGDGSLANFPTSTGGGASVSYYLNGSVSQGTIGGVAYKEINGVPVIGTGTDFTINADGYIAQFITDVGDPNKLLIPAGNWNFETYFSASSGGGSPRFYIELYKYNGATFTLIATNSATPEYITGGTTIDLYFTALAIPPTTLLATDRLAVRFYVIHSGRTITMHTENSHLSQIITTFSTGLTALNGLTTQVQSFATGTSGTDFGISSATSTHTFNLPTASATNRGALSTTDWNTFNGKFNLPSLTSGSVLFSNGTTIAQDNAQLFWDDTNNRLGIGTTTPGAKLDVNLPAGAFGSGNPYNILSYGNSNIFRVYMDGNWNYVNEVIQNGVNQSGYIISTNSSERMRITSSGNVGIGTITPTHPLNVYTTTADVGILLDSNTNPAFIIKRAGVERLKLSATGSIGTINGLGNGLAFQTDNTERARISNGGNFLVNTQTDNGGKLQIKAPGALSTDIALRVRNSADSADLMLVNGLGNVGIGTSTLTNKFNLNGNFEFQGIAQTSRYIVTNESSTGTGRLVMQAGLGSASFGGSLMLYANAHATYPGHVVVGLSQNASAKFRVNASSLDGDVDFFVVSYTNGNTGIGTSNPVASAKLDITSTTQGVLFPRMTTTQKNAIATPATGLVVFDTTLNKLCVRGASAWETITSL